MVHHRLNRGGDRQLNRALHTVALVRLRGDPGNPRLCGAPAAEGKSTREIRRCVKRAIARQLFKLLQRYDHPNVEVVHVAYTPKAGSPACSHLACTPGERSGS